MAGKKRPISILQLPTEQLTRFNGLALDFGGSLIKVVYLDKEDIKAQKSQLKLVSFPGNEMTEFFEFVKKNCYIKRQSENDKPLIYTCGVGSYQYAKQFEEEFGVIAENLNELDCHINALKYFVERSNLPLDAFSIQTSLEVTEKVQREMTQGLKLRARMVATGKVNMIVRDNGEEIFNAKHDPTKNINKYILGILGSASACFRFTEDGKYSMFNMVTFGGKSFLGLGALLTGAKTYEELMALAEMGDSKKVDFTYADIMTGGEKSKESDVYAFAEDFAPRPLFLWGKAVQGDLANFKKKDIARSLLYTLCRTAVSMVLHACYMTGSRHAFLSGSFINHPLTQEIITEEFELEKMRNAYEFEEYNTDYHLHILRNAGHIGALGTFLPENAS